MSQKQPIYNLPSLIITVYPSHSFQCKAKTWCHFYYFLCFPYSLKHQKILLALPINIHQEFDLHFLLWPHPFFQDTSFFLRLNHCLGTLASSLFQLLLTITYKVAIIGLTICNLRGLLSICQTYQTSSCIKVLELAWRFFITAYIIPDFSWNHHQINLCKLVYVFCPRKLRNVLWNMKKYTS